MAQRRRKPKNCRAFICKGKGHQHVYTQVGSLHGPRGWKILLFRAIGPVRLKCGMKHRSCRAMVFCLVAWGFTHPTYPLTTRRKLGPLSTPHSSRSTALITETGDSASRMSSVFKSGTFIVRHQPAPR